MEANNGKGGHHQKDPPTLTWYRHAARGRSIVHPLSGAGTDALEKDDLESLVVKLRANSITEEEKLKLFRSHIRLAIYTASLYSPSNNQNQTDELVSESLLGLQIAITKAAEKLVDNNFTAYARCKMHSRVKRFLERQHTFSMPARTRNHYKNTCPEKLVFFEPKVINIEVCIDPFRKLYRLREVSPRKSRLKEIRETLDASIKTESERQVIELREQGYVDTEISVILNMSHTKVYQLRKKVEKRFNKLEHSNGYYISSVPKLQKMCPEPGQPETR